MKNSKNMFSINIDCISRFRTECMGLATIWVLAVHALDFGIHLPPWLAIAEKLMGYGQVGVNMFFFLSGIGMYFSLGKRDSLTHFYINRCKRVFVSYLLISFPYLVVLQIMNGFRPLWFVLDLTTLSYWIAQRGTWYVPVIMLLYALIPFYEKLYRKMKRHGTITLLSVILCALFAVVMQKTSIPFLARLGGAVSRVPVF